MPGTVRTQRRSRPAAPAGPSKAVRLASQPVFGGCTPAQIRAAAACCDEVEVRAGDIIVRRGSQGRWWFLVAEGTAEIRAPSGERRAVLWPGDPFGWSALTAGAEQTTVAARTTATMLVFERRAIERLLDAIPALRPAVAQQLGSSPAGWPGLQRQVLDAWGRSAEARTAHRRAVRRARLRLCVRTGLAAAALCAWGAAYHPPVAVVAPGEAFDAAADIRIEGVPARIASTRYLATPVEIVRPSALGALAALWNRDEAVLPLSRLAGPGAVGSRTVQRDVFRRSRILAAAAAARAAGLPVRSSGTGARVVAVDPGSPGSWQLRPGDVIVSVDGRPVTIAADVGSALSSRSPGSVARVRVMRAGTEIDVDALVSEPYPPQDGASAIGVRVATRDLRLELPFRVRFADRDVGGPSAGLAYALAIADMLGAGPPSPRVVAATGAVDPDGLVSEVCCAAQKSLAARHAGASLFLAPVRDEPTASGRGVTVTGVWTLAGAREALRPPRAG